MSLQASDRECEGIVSDGFLAPVIVHLDDFLGWQGLDADHPKFLRAEAALGVAEL